MLVEKNLSEALKDFDKGKHVLVMNEMIDGTFSVVPLESYFAGDTHFLVDVPAYVNSKLDQVLYSAPSSEKDEGKAEPEGCNPPPLKREGENVKKNL